MWNMNIKFIISEDTDDFNAKATSYTKRQAVYYNHNPFNHLQLKALRINDKCVWFHLSTIGTDQLTVFAPFLNILM